MAAGAMVWGHHYRINRQTRSDAGSMNNPNRGGRCGELSATRVDARAIESVVRADRRDRFGRQARRRLYHGSYSCCGVTWEGEGAIDHGAVHRRNLPRPERAQTYGRRPRYARAAPSRFRQGAARCFCSDAHPQRWEPTHPVRRSDASAIIASIPLRSGAISSTTRLAPRPVTSRR